MASDLAPAMVMTRRERLRAATVEEIKAIARRQMAEQGATHLSLRAIAREMGLTAPALYRYFADRDDLITALIVAAFTALAEAVETAAADLPAADYVGRLLVMTLAFRDWAVAHPTDWMLIYGTPIPGYVAPREVTTPPARRVFAPFVTTLQAAWTAGRLTPPAAPAALPAALVESLVAWGQDDGLDLPPPVLQTILGVWATMQGLISLELFGHLQPIVGDPADLYRAEARAFLVRFGLD